MLTLDQIVALQNMGFAYEQIAKLNAMDATLTPAGASKPEPEPEPKPEPKPEPEKPAEPEPEPEKPAEPEPVPAKSAEIERLTKQIAELAATVKALQAENVKLASHEPPKPLTAEDVIKSFMEAS